MLLETAIGDAYGFGFEYANENLPLNTLERYVKHPVLALAPGKYTDDTQMTLAVAEWLLSEKNPPTFSTYEMTKKFYETFNRDRRVGYSKQFQALLDEVKDGDELFLKIRSDSDKSGGAMRAGPCGVLSSPQEVIYFASLQASVTHNTIDGRAAAAAAALMTHYFLYDLGPKAEVGEYLNEWLPSRTATDRDWDEPWSGEVKAKGWMAVRAALTAIKQHSSLAAILKASVAFSGDVDTVGAIAMSAASCSKEVEKDLPAVLYDGLEDGQYGKKYLAQLDVRLMKLQASLK